MTTPTKPLETEHDRETTAAAQTTSRVRKPHIWLKDYLHMAMA